MYGHQKQATDNVNDEQKEKKNSEDGTAALSICGTVWEECLPWFRQSVVLRPATSDFGPKWDFSGCHYACCVNVCPEEKLKKWILMNLLVSCM